MDQGLCVWGNGDNQTQLGETAGQGQLNGGWPGASPESGMIGPR